MNPMVYGIMISRLYGQNDREGYDLAYGPASLREGSVSGFSSAPSSWIYYGLFAGPGVDIKIHEKVNIHAALVAGRIWQNTDNGFGQFRKPDEFGLGIDSLDLSYTPFTPAFAWQIKASLDYQFSKSFSLRLGLAVWSTRSTTEKTYIRYLRSGPSILDKETTTLKYRIMALNAGLGIVFRF